MHYTNGALYLNKYSITCMAIIIWKKCHVLLSLFNLPFHPYSLFTQCRMDSQKLWNEHE